MTRRIIFCGLMMGALWLAPLTAQGQKYRQVRLEMTILEWTLDDSLDYGFAIDYAKPLDSNADLESGDIVLPPPSIPEQGIRIFLDNFNWGGAQVEAVIEALEQVGKVRVLYEVAETCQIADLPPDTDSHAVGGKDYLARVHSGQELASEEARPAGNTLVSYTIFRDVGITMEFLPRRVVEDSYILLNLHTVLNDQVGSLSVGVNARQEPIFAYVYQERELSNTILARDSDLVMCAVLKSNTSASREAGIPWLAQIPILGYLFKSRSSTSYMRELVFLVRPILIDIEVDEN